MKTIIRKAAIISLLLFLVFPVVLLGEEEPINFERASAHDPSVIKAKDRSYYVFGTHIAAAKSDDLVHWKSIVESEYQTPDNNPIYGDLSENLAESFEWAGEDDADSRGGYAVWAPDIFWNKDYVWEDGSRGAYMLYYSASSTYIRSAIGIAVSKSIEGPYQYSDTIMYSGFTNYEAYDNNSDVNKHWENTNISKLIEEGILHEENPDWFTGDGNFNNAFYTNAIDPTILYDKNDNLWMIYGSWSGGIFLLELDKETGVPVYPGEDSETSDGRMIDRYFGTKIAGGFGRSAEGPYAVYDEETDYYYLYVTYGGLASDGGYQMRQFRSKNITGPYEDAAGKQAVFPESFDLGPGNFPGNNDHKEIGNKMMGNFLFKRDLGEAGEGIGTGYMAPGHNSYLIDEELGKEFIVMHTRFPEQGEMHQVRVHQTFKNREQWPVPTPYHYAGETIEPVTKEDVIGDYKYINHGKEITGELTESTWIQLQEDQTVTGAISGTWELSEDYRVLVTIEGKEYDGVFIRQYDQAIDTWVLTFSAMSNEGVVIWGSHSESKDEKEVAAGIKQELSEKIPDEVLSSLSLPELATQGAEIFWESSHPEVISSKGTVERPPSDAEDVEVILTATITLGAITETFTANVIVPAEQEGSLTAYYGFDDGLSDQSGTQKDAEITGDRINNTGGEISFAEGVAGKAAKFDGASGLKLADGLITGDKYSIALWMKPEEIIEFTTAFFGTRTENNWISIAPNAHGVSKVWVHNGVDWYDAGVDSIVPAGEWTHFALTANEGETKVYINGEEEFSGNGFPDVFTTSDAQFSLGVNYWDAPFKGLMDEVRVYDGLVLSEADIQNLYQNPGENEEEEVPDEKDNAEEEDSEENTENTEQPDQGQSDEESEQDDNAAGENDSMEEGEVKEEEDNDELASETDSEAGKRLPDTASNHYNWLAAGLLFIVLGLSLTFYLWRKRQIS